jgi:hypothetical protein
LLLLFIRSINLQEMSDSTGVLTSIIASNTITAKDADALRILFQTESNCNFAEAVRIFDIMLSNVPCSDTSTQQILLKACNNLILNSKLVAQRFIDEAGPNVFLQIAATSDDSDVADVALRVVARIATHSVSVAAALSTSQALAQLRDAVLRHSNPVPLSRVTNTLKVAYAVCAATPLFPTESVAVLLELIDTIAADNGITPRTLPPAATLNDQPVPHFVNLCLVAPVTVLEPLVRHNLDERFVFWLISLGTTTDTLTEVTAALEQRILLVLYRLIYQFPSASRIKYLLLPKQATNLDQAEWAAETLHKLLQSPNEQTRTVAEELVFVLCNESADECIAQLGMGLSAGLLYRKSLIAGLSDSPAV